MSKKDPFQPVKMLMGMTGTARDKKFMLFAIPVCLVLMFAARYVDDSVYSRKRNDEAVLEKKWANEEAETLEKIGRRNK